ncbi:MAG: hypothetical protein ABFS32_22535 [Bacteroidota bacterium]
MKKALSIIWSLIVAFVFSALIHSIDSDVSSLGAAVSSQNILSVVLVSWIIALPMFLCMLLFQRHGLKGYIVTLVTISIVQGTILGFAGSTAQASNEIIVSVISMIVLSIFICGIGSLPNVYITFRTQNTV